MNNSSEPSTPALTAVVVIPDTYTTVARTMAALENQTAAARLEIVFIVPPGAAATVPSHLAAHFNRVQIVEFDNIWLAPAFAEGVRHATAPVVASTEDHAFPAPNWAERLIAAHQGPFSAVGPAMRNAYPSVLVSCADFYMGYGKWAAPIESGAFDFLMEHNCSYKRDVLLTYGAALPQVLESETSMQYDLARRGHTFWLEATTYTEHICFGEWKPWLASALWHSRGFAQHRSARWSLGRRILYTLTFPLIPFVRFPRIRRDIARAKLPAKRRFEIYAVLFVGLMVEAIGQGLGYAVGAGDPSQSYEHEFHRVRHQGAIPVTSAE